MATGPAGRSHVSVGSQRDARHTYGRSCRLAPVPQPLPDAWLEGIPAPNAQFFYSSPISLDDPLSAATAPTNAAADAKAGRLPLRPFSQGDNNTLEKAWLALSGEENRKAHAAARRHRSPSPSVGRANEKKLAVIVRGLAARHRQKHNQEEAGNRATTMRATLQGATTDLPVCCEQLSMDAAAELAAVFCPLARKQLQSLPSADVVVQQIMLALGDSSRRNSSISNLNGSGIPVTPAESQTGCGATAAVPRSIPRVMASSRHDMPSPRRFDPLPSSSLPTVDDGISGKPFLRADKVLEEPNAPAAPPQPVVAQEVAKVTEAAEAAEAAVVAEVAEASRILDNLKASAAVPVGVSRLHVVDLPALQMRPIYWSPVNDIAVVQRATWFYRDTMLPLEAVVANQLESLYRELRPWTETWADELRCALDVGAVGEEKVSQPLWPRPPSRGGAKTRGGVELPAPLVSSEMFCASRCLQGAAAVEGTLGLPEENLAAALDAAQRNYSNYQVVFQNGQTAFLLKPSLKPSAYYGRRPIAKIWKGATVGIPVVRGFDRSRWMRSHERQQKNDVPVREDREARQYGLEVAGQASCPGCEAERMNSQVTDLVLVAHGVGQKLAERVESFHFTHAVNGLRRDVNVELGNSAVQAVLRPDHNGIMMLPVNWRHTVSFEDGDPVPGQPFAAGEGYSLKDIEPGTIPAVRSIISDVMFDIPFYMSHHKPKMIRALVREANRVYRLWCRNNPGFAEHGRVHLIGHSLGSAMAIEVLSKQPTVPPPLDLSTTSLQSAFFEFDTKNLFLLGSPAAFFLLLERGSLVPRRGRRKPGSSEPSDGSHSGPDFPDGLDSSDSRVVGEMGTFGCLAVDNIYNILAKEDPIAYLLNGTVDTAYAASLKPAYVPSTTLGFFASIGHSLRNVVPGMAAAPPPTVSSLPVPNVLPMPSQLELEVHDFTREEIAERKTYLLNDNGQIDYYLHSGGGPLEIQYLNMLSAHTSYWTNPDLIRMLCVEIGRRPGRKHTLPAMRAVKASKRAIPNAS